MAKRRTKMSRNSARRGRVQPLVEAAVTPPVPTDREMMVMAGNRPHETTLHDFTWEDFGLDVLSVIHPDRP